MFVYFGQLGLGGLTENEKLEFIDYLNSSLRADGAGRVEIVRREEIHTNDAFGMLGDVLNVITAMKLIAEASKSKKLRYFFDKAGEWLKSKNMDTSAHSEARRMIDFLESDEDDKNTSE